MAGDFRIGFECKIVSFNSPILNKVICNYTVWGRVQWFEAITTQQTIFSDRHRAYDLCV